MKNIAKNRFLAGSLFAAVLSGAPQLAAADEPIVIDPPPIVFVDADPCNGGTHTLTIDVVFTIHINHMNNRVQSSVRTGTTDSGYEIIRGQAHTVFMVDGISSWLRDVWQNDDGQMFEATSSLFINPVTGAVRFQPSELRCIIE
jgi:hypothetical protein